MDTTLAGNAAAGALGEVFAADVTTAMATCAACGHRSQVGELLAYLGGPGVVLRCARCDGAEIRMVSGPGRTWLDLRGVSVLEISDGR